MKRKWITPCGRETNSHGEEYNKKSFEKHVESCHRPECREYIARIRTEIGHQGGAYLRREPR